MSPFFVSCALGFENDLVTELKSFWFEMMDLDGLPTRSLLPEYEVVPGGVQFKTYDHLGYQINFFSKLANRVLIRVAQFESRYFDQFEKEIKKIDLSKWLEPQSLNLKIETHKSRLNNQNSLSESLTKLLLEKKYKINTDEESQVLFVRIEKDRVTLSLDTSGLHLHKRGYALYRGEAPLRETLAAFVIKQLQKNLVDLDSLTLLDPFVGSGTLLFESVAEQLPLFYREYAWMRFQNRPKLFKSESWLKNYRWLAEKNPIHLVGFDQNPKAIESLQKNSEIFKKIFPSAQYDLKSYCGDSLTVDLSPFKNLSNAWLVTNPPYGHRLTEGAALQILHRFEEHLPLRGLIVLHPESWSFDFKKLRLVSKLDFKNQGLRLKLSVYSV